MGQQLLPQAGQSLAATQAALASPQNLLERPRIWQLKGYLGLHRGPPGPCPHPHRLPAATWLVRARTRPTTKLPPHKPKGVSMFLLLLCLLFALWHKSGSHLNASLNKCWCFPPRRIWCSLIRGMSRLSRGESKDSQDACQQPRQVAFVCILCNSTCAKYIEQTLMDDYIYIKQAVCLE